MMFDTFDRTGTVEFPFPKQVVFRALCRAVERLGSMRIENRDELACRLDMSAGMSAFSWGEKISVAVSGNGDQAAVLSVQSGAKTILGSATVHGKNRKNVREIINGTSEVLREHGAIWRDEMFPTPATASSSAGTSRLSVADELTKLANLRDQRILSDHEFLAQKARLLG